MHERIGWYEELCIRLCRASLVVVIAGQLLMHVAAINALVRLISTCSLPNFLGVVSNDRHEGHAFLVSMVRFLFYLFRSNRTLAVFSCQFVMLYLIVTFHRPPSPRLVIRRRCTGARRHKGWRGCHRCRGSLLGIGA